MALDAAGCRALLAALAEEDPFCPPPPEGACTGAAIEDGVDYLQADSPLLRAVSPAACCALCAALRECAAWTWRGPADLVLNASRGEWRNCWLKPTKLGRKEDASTKGLTSGTFERGA